VESKHELVWSSAVFCQCCVTYQLLNLASNSYLASAINFFIYDVIKIGILLVLINYLMAVVRYYLPVNKINQILTGRKWYGLDYVVAALLGVITPFCSCSSIPLFIGFLSAGIPIGVTLTFLIASPLVNEASLFLFPAMFGLEVALLYNLIGILVAIVGGYAIGKLSMEKFVQPEFANLGLNSKQQNEVKKHPPLKVLAVSWWHEGMVITRQIFPYVLLGVGIGALIHGFVPERLFEQYLAVDEWWVIPLAVLVGVPLYANSVSVLPIIEALVGKGIQLGTALAFMTAVVTLSIPEALMLKKAMRWQLLFAFFGITIIGIMILGYVFNWID
jgi:uncharacterized membrane protein YraQ (UPF0718 family)